MYFPISQPQTALLEVEIVPDGQAVQTLDEVAPVAVEYVPSGHNVHELDATIGAYVPEGQDIQSVIVLEPGSEYVPVGHLWEHKSPYRPPGQGLQPQSPAAEYVPMEHFIQTLDEVAPSTEEAVPAGQSVHDELPVTSE